MKLLIVESPGKIKKLQGFLGPGYKVMASCGHVRDLPTKGFDLGVKPPDFKPKYVTTEQGKKKLNELALAVKNADAVYLGSDPDREGEAIAWHLKEALMLKNPYRVAYPEITEKAVKAALASPRAIDMNLVHAQEGRRVLDRLVGYLVSGPVSRKVQGQGGLSTGRVQSPALRLVVDREHEIRDFHPTTHYGAEFTFNDQWKAQWDTADWRKAGEQYFLDQATAERVSALKSFTVTAYEEGESHQAPPAPFTTATLQQAASTSLKLSPTETMALAQKLYEGGAITYMRTDYPNLSGEAFRDIVAWGRQHNLPIVAQQRTWKSEDGAQEAHEAIRPTHFEVEEAGRDEGERQLYALIRQRALASQMAEAVFAVTKATLAGELDGEEVTLKATGRRLVSPGWRALAAGDTECDGEEGQEAEAKNPIQRLQEGQTLEGEGRLLTKMTKPPARFTEASLVGELKKRGIGRPSTYAHTISLIQKRGYAQLVKRQLAPTEIGEKLIAATVGRFAFLDYDFTRDMEAKLDDIAAGKAEYVAMVRDVYNLIQNELDNFNA